jgi:hypothetical protein
MLQRGGEVVIRMLENVKQATIGPLIDRMIAKGTLVYTDEYDIHSRLAEWGYGHKTVCHGPASSLVTTMEMDSARCMSTHWKGSGRCSVRGSGRTEESRRRACRCTWVSSSSFITSGREERGYWVP